MKKQRLKIFNKQNFLLGIDRNGTKYYLKEFSWDCDWYWGGGYVETYTNNNHPQLSRDISSHSHFDHMFANGNKNAFDSFKEFFLQTPFEDKEIWKICELMNSFYTARKYSDMIHRGGANYTENPAKETIKSDSEYFRINRYIIPAIAVELYKILDPNPETIEIAKIERRLQCSL